MRFKPFHNQPESQLHRVLSRAVSTRPDYVIEDYWINSKTHLSEVFETDLDDERNDKEAVDFLRSPFAHFDFTIHSQRRRHPLCAVEFDGPGHQDPKQRARDIKKNRICAKATLAILRIDQVENHFVDDLHKMPLIEWLIRRWIRYEKEMPQLLRDEEAWISSVPSAERQQVATFEASAEHLFWLSHPYPLLVELAESLLQNHGIADSLALERGGVRRGEIDSARWHVVLRHGGPMPDLRPSPDGFSQRTICGAYVVDSQAGPRPPVLFSAEGEYISQSFYPIKEGQQGPGDLKDPVSGRLIAAPAGPPWAAAPSRLGPDLAWYHALKQVEAWARKNLRR
ncbi:DUF2726 domain-containing protein [Amycolatopsis sp. NPDC051102]|uniref:DUF2726 domain-containing protein n=1 Tax=Amycolatopsis sp. NPDC051102 TaxID=3155163 RepID=UPI003420E706